ncbi:Tubulin/FtsZ, GTPase domain [Phytophthora cactorum]|nr:Tubulin/FtsZ, GTPase domain [Phytophthora cactorum]
MLALQVGQCGNQLGRALFDKLAEEEDATSSRDSAFFHSPEDFCNERSVVRASNTRRARAVLIDMEPKVIQQCYKPSKSRKAASAWEYEPKNSFTRQSGSGNNWASGYGRRVRKRKVSCWICCSRISHAAERSRRHRLWTGLFLTEKLADFYPSTSLLNAVVWPYQSGEVIVQNYNAISPWRVSQTSVRHFHAAERRRELICQKLLRIPHPSFEQ